MHIAVVGIEKIVPTWEDFATLVQLLPHFWTAHDRLRQYIPATLHNLLMVMGQEHFYLVLVDNGRSDIYASEYTSASLHPLRGVS